MIFELKFDELEELRDEMTGAIDELETFEQSFKNLLENVTDETKNEAIDNLDKNAQEVIEQFKSLREAFETQTEALEGYIEGHDEINLHNEGQEYILDTDESYQKNNWTIHDLERMERVSENNKLEDFIEGYNAKKREFAELNLPTVLADYEGKEQKQEYVKERDTSISEIISDFDRNVGITEEITHSLAKFEDKAESVIEAMESFNEQIEEISEFEESYNPGFFDKHEKGIRILTTIIMPVSAIYRNFPGAYHFVLTVGGCIPGIGWAFDLTNAFLYACEGDWTNAALSGLAVVPGVGASIAGAKMTSTGAKGFKFAGETWDLFKAYQKGGDAFKAVDSATRLGVKELAKLDDVLRIAGKSELAINGVDLANTGASVVKGISNEDYDDVVQSLVEGNLSKYEIAMALAKIK